MFRHRLHLLKNAFSRLHRVTPKVTPTIIVRHLTDCGDKIARLHMCSWFAFASHLFRLKASLLDNLLINESLLWCRFSLTVVHRFCVLGTELLLLKIALQYRLSALYAIVDISFFLSFFLDVIVTVHSTRRLEYSITPEEFVTNEAGVLNMTKPLYCKLEETILTRFPYRNQLTFPEPWSFSALYSFSGPLFF